MLRNSLKSRDTISALKITLLLGFHALKKIGSLVRENALLLASTGDDYSRAELSRASKKTAFSRARARS